MAAVASTAVGFCTDANYIRFVPAAIESLVKAYGAPDLPQFHIVTDAMPPADAERSLLELSQGRLDIHVIDPADFMHLKEVTHISRGMYYRLALPSLALQDRILYLDCDIIVRGDIYPLLRADLGERPVGAVVNPFYNATNIGFDSTDLYFNSGVLLIDRRKWIKLNVSELTLKFLVENTDSLVMPDQDALNGVLRGNWQELHPTFNCQTSMFIRHEDLAAELAGRWDTNFLDDPVIVHFSSSHKQWHPTCRLKYARDYRKLSSHVMQTRKGMLVDLATSLWRRLAFSGNPYFT